MLISLDGQKVSPGEKFFLLDSSGKKKAIVRIRQTKNDKAVAELVKGVPEIGMNLLAIAPATPTKPSYVPLGKSYTPVSGRSGAQWGLVGSLLKTDMQVNFTPSGTGTKTSVAMKGMSYGVLGLYDYSFSPELQIRGLGGLEILQASGTAAGATDCDGSSDCNVNITYLSSYGTLKYNFYRKDFNLWAGGFYGFLFALSKSSSVLKAADITANQVYGFSGGVDYPLKQKGTFIPVSLDYGFFPSSATVKASILYIRAGWAKNF